MNYISNLIIPLMIVVIIIYGVRKNISVYDSFIDGAVSSFSMVKTLFPTFLAMVLGVNILINSGFITFFVSFFEGILTLLKVPIEILPMAIIRPISGSASLAILNNILKTSGPDSFIGLLAATMQGATDTTFYVITLYFGSVGIKKIRYSLWVGLCADLIGIVTSIIIMNQFFG